MLTHKPLNIPAWDFINAWKKGNIQIVGNIRKPEKNSTFWKFKIESSYYPGFYYIPGYTNYVANEDGKIISLFKGIEIIYHLNRFGYPTANLVADDSLDDVITIHPLIAFTFNEWKVEDVFLVIDHIDGDTTNPKASNLEFVTQAENMRRAKENNFYGKREVVNDIYIRDLKTNEVNIVKRQKDAADIIGCGLSVVQGHLTKAKANGTIKSRYIVAYVKDESDIQHLNERDAKYFDLRSGSQSRPTLVKNVVTGEVKRFEKMKDAFNYVSSKTTAVTRKPFTDTLKKNIQRRYGDYIPIYEDVHQEWIA